MAITGKYSTSSGTNLNIIAYYSYTQDTDSNKSTVTVTLKAAHNRLNGSALSGSYLSVAGNKVSYTKAINHTSYTDTETTLATKTVTITHSSEGNATCQIKAAFVFNGTVSGTYIGTLSINKTLTLKTIPRASSISKIANSSGTSITSLDSGSVVRVYWTPASSSFKYRVTMTVSGTTLTFPSSSTYYSPGKTSSYGTPASDTGVITTAHSWLPSSTSGKVTVKLYTYNSSGTQIGVKSASFTLNVPSSVKPKITSFTASLVSGLNGYYVQGKSKVKLNVASTKGSGATGIKSYIFTGKNIYGTNETRTISSTATSYSLTSSILQYDGSWPYKVRVTDSRGRWAEATLENKIKVYPYFKPEITSISVTRCLKDGTISSSGTYAAVTVVSKYATINGANTRTIALSNSADNYASSVTIQSTSNTATKATYIYGNGSFAIGSVYVIKATITDTGYKATHSKDTELQTAERPLNIAKYGNGVAVGGISTVESSTADGLFECNWSTEIHNKLSVTGNVTTDSRFGCTSSYDDHNFNIYCQWRDGDNHDILVRNSDGLTMGIGWVGDSNNQTVCDIRPKKVNIRGETTIQGFRVPEIQHGNISISPSAANTPTSKIVTFKQEFTGNPDIVVSAHTSVPGTTVLGVGTANRDTTGCTIWVTRTNTTDTTINWIAAY